MSRGCVAVDRGMSLHEFVDIYLLKTAQRCFAVQDEGRLAGIITRHDVSAIPRESWDFKTVGDAMRPLRELQIVSPDTSVSDALKLTAGNGADFLPVVESGKLEGIAYRSQLLYTQGQGTKLPMYYQRLLYSTSKVAEHNA